jgi:hypothetical protein
VDIVLEEYIGSSRRNLEAGKRKNSLEWSILVKLVLTQGNLVNQSSTTNIEQCLEGQFVQK